MLLFIQRRREDQTGRYTLADSQGLNIAEEKRLVFFDGTAQGPAKLVLAELRTGHAGFIGEEIVGVELVVAQELIKTAVESVGPGLSQQIDHGPARAAHFRGVAVGIHLHLLDHVDGRPQEEGELLALIVVHPVDQLIVEYLVQAVGSDVGGLAPLVGARAAQNRIGRPRRDTDGTLN